MREYYAQQTGKVYYAIIYVMRRSGERRNIAKSSQVKSSCL